MNIYEEINFPGYEKIISCYNPKTNLNAIISIHSTLLGPAVGGCRIWNYKNKEEALKDVLKLSKNMTYKSAMADLSLGGGKAVAWGDITKYKSKELLISLAEFVNYLEGKYIIAEDVGTNLEDMEFINTISPFVGSVKGSGDPSKMTAYGVFLGINACIDYYYDVSLEDLDYLSIVIQGVGAVGSELVKHFSSYENVEIYINDINLNKIQDLRTFYPRIRYLENIHNFNGDIFIPCALGNAITGSIAENTKYKIIAGSANNQLEADWVGEILFNRDILYAPDYIINAGGIINVSCEIDTEYSEDIARKKTNKIYDILLNIFGKSFYRKLPTNKIADLLVEEKLNNAK